MKRLLAIGNNNVSLVLIKHWTHLSKNLAIKLKQAGTKLVILGFRETTIWKEGSLRDNNILNWKICQKQKDFLRV